MPIVEDHTVKYRAAIKALFPYPILESPLMWKLGFDEYVAMSFNFVLSVSTYYFSWFQSICIRNLNVLSRFQMIRCVIMQIKTAKKSLQIPLKLNNENAVHLKSVIYYGNLQQIQKMKANKNVQNM